MSIDYTIFLIPYAWAIFICNDEVEFLSFNFLQDNGFKIVDNNISIIGVDILEF